MPRSTEVSYLASWGPGSLVCTVSVFVKEEFLRAANDEKSTLKLIEVLFSNVRSFSWNCLGGFFGYVQY